MRARYFFSFLLRRKKSGAEIGYGEGIVECPEITQAEGLDRLRFTIVEKWHADHGDDPDYKIDTYDVHFISLSLL